MLIAKISFYFERAKKTGEKFREKFGFPYFKRQNFHMWFKYGLKAQKLLTQGIALGVITDANLSPCKGKSFKIPGNKQSFNNKKNKITC